MNINVVLYLESSCFSEVLRDGAYHTCGCCSIRALSSSVVSHNRVSVDINAPCDLGHFSHLVFVVACGRNVFQEHSAF